MNIHHWLPAQIEDMDLCEFWRVYDATVKWRQAEADAIAAATGGA